MIVAEGWIGVALISATVILVTGAMCWVISDADRPARLAMLLRAWRGTASARTRHQRRKKGVRGGL
jgi:hypothetical protein